jgi:tRNA(Ile2) C34 agmatinyltransferase TiaS
MGKTPKKSGSQRVAYKRMFNQKRGIPLDLSHVNMDKLVATWDDNEPEVCPSCGGTLNESTGHCVDCGRLA